MKYCVHYHRNSPFRYFDEVDEIEVTFRKEDLSVPAFLEKYADKDIIMTVNKAEDIPLIADLAEKYKNFRIRIDYYEQELKDAVLESNIPFFFMNLVDDWDTLTGMIKLHPTDVYIVNELGFELDRVSKFAHDNNVKIRVFPNVAQSSWGDTEGIKKFFIRPEDIDFYESYVDVMEFFGEEKKISVYYDIYAHDKQWFGKLNEILIDFNSDIDNRGIMPIFAESRVKCGKRCLKGHSCEICPRIEHLAQTLIDHSLIVRPPKKDS